jgi:hypothetical protein
MIGVAMEMRDGDDDDLLLANCIDQTIRESFEATTSDLVVESLASFWEAAYPFDGGVEFVAKILAKPRALSLVILRHGFHVARRAGTDAERHRQLTSLNISSSSLRTSSTGIAASFPES